MNRAEFFQRWQEQLRKNPRYRGCCFYCGAVMSCTFGPFLKTQEHIVPQNRNKHCAMNVVGACISCNGAKNGFSVDEFRSWYGDPFFCEKIVGAPLPSDTSSRGDGEFSIDFSPYLKDFHSRCAETLHRYFEVNKGLDRRLRKIVGEYQNQRKTAMHPKVLFGGLNESAVSN